MMEVYDIEFDSINLIKLTEFFKDKTIVNQDFLLNKQKTNLDIIEQFVDCISKFHINKLNLLEKHYIEFCFSNEKRQQRDVLVNKYPALTCITYLNSDNSLAITTNILTENYKYKEINDDIKLCCFFPSELKSIVLPGNLKVIDSCDNSKRLIINIWNEQPLTNIYYDKSNGNEKITNFKIKKNENKIKTIRFGKEIEYNHVEYLIYSNDDLLKRELLKMLNNNKSTPFESTTFDMYLFIKENNKKQKEEALDEEHMVNLLEPKYLQNYYNKYYYNNIMCDWIMHELDKNSLTNIDSEIPLENIETIAPFVLHSSINIIELIEEYYNISNCSFNIKNIYIKKDNLYKKFEETIIINILLNDNKKDNNQYICFDNGIKIKLNKGDMIAYNGEEPFTMSSNNYILVIMINIYKK